LALEHGKNVAALLRLDGVLGLERARAPITRGTEPVANGRTFRSRMRLALVLFFSCYQSGERYPGARRVSQPQI